MERFTRIGNRNPIFLVGDPCLPWLKFRLL